jgi:hypothetical protein
VDQAFTMAFSAHAATQAILPSLSAHWSAIDVVISGRASGSRRSVWLES